MITSIHVTFVTVCIVLSVGMSSNSLHFGAATAGNGAGILVPGDPACDLGCTEHPKVYFCASNGRTLDSECKVQEAQCNDPYLNVTAGKCKNSIRCLKEKRYILKVHSLPNGTQPVHVPTCKPDGSFAPIQCNVYLGYCWCVTPLGTMKKNSTFEIGKKPSCGKSRSKPKAKKDKCKNDAEKAAFALKLRALIVQGYERHPLSTSQMQRSVVTAKHTKMDKNNDGSLNLREMKNLLRPHRKKLPRACTRVFMAFCDVNDNRKVSEFEWSICLGVRPFKRKQRVIVITKPSDVLQEEEPEIISVPQPSPVNNESLQTMPQVKRTCKEVRFGIIRDNPKNVKAPQCDETDSQYWSPVQCHGMYCYCVMSETGAPIKGTSVRYGKPNCEIAKLSDEISVPIPGCPQRLKRKFLSQVQKVLVEEMVEALSPTGDIQSAYPTNPAQTTKERAARWFFDDLDENGDRVLSRKENKKFKKLLRGRKVTKKCLTNFIKHCDRDSDKKIRKNEFIACLEVRQQERYPPRPELSRSITQLKTTDDPDNL
ncbi:SPARC-related modular calcium-binding protein 2-like [Styela clava]|uniref:SPARC-related modular calcium-binding protein 1-like n=1 Tax=Styela clava TaxID=7725 RepID=UPI00193ACE95|nr:SPARC-related modular calcium-binding protein 1-like [Styela clava]